MCPLYFRTGSLGHMYLFSSVCPANPNNPPSVLEAHRILFDGYQHPVNYIFVHFNQAALYLLCDLDSYLALVLTVAYYIAVSSSPGPLVYA